MANLLDDPRVQALVLAAGRARPILAASGDPKALTAARSIDAALAALGQDLFPGLGIPLGEEKVK